MFDEQPDGDPHGECALEIKTLQARIAELEAERDALKVDAERYRWLRDGELPADGDWPVAVEGHQSRRALWSDELDAAIDAAMNQPKESGQ